MKVINIKGITPKRNIYQIVLGNGNLIEKKSLKQAKKVLVELNRFLTDRTYELNKIYGQLLEYHRIHIWGYCDPFNERAANNYFSNIQKSFELAFERSHYENGNHFTFHHLKNICTNLRDITRLFKLFDKKRNKNIELHLWDAQIEYINAIQQKIKTYGSTQAAFEFEVSSSAEQTIIQLPNILENYEKKINQAGTR